MRKKIATLGLFVTAMVSVGHSAEGPTPKGVPHLSHVYVIMMENHGYSQIVNNPNAPFINQYARSANSSTNYFAVAHPSLTNYLEVVGGSNFGVLNDNSPDWHNATCSPNLATGTTSLDDGTFPPICPIAGTGTDAATPAVDTTNETSGPPGDNNIDGIQSIPAADNIAARRSPINWQRREEPGRVTRKICPSQGPITLTTAMVSLPTRPTSLRSCQP